MNNELHNTLRELLICAEIILEFEVLDTKQVESAQQIHHWASFLANLSEKIHQLSGKYSNLAPYYRTMEAPLRRIINYADGLLKEDTAVLTLNQEYSFQRIRRLAQQAASLAQQTISELSPKSSDTPTIHSNR